MKEIITIENAVFAAIFNQSRSSFMKCPTTFYFHMFLHTNLFHNKHVLDPNRLATLYTCSQTLRKYEIFSLSLNVGYTSLHDIAVVLRGENVYSYNNEKLFGQGDLSHSLY